MVGTWLLLHMQTWENCRQFPIKSRVSDDLTTFLLVRKLIIILPIIGAPKNNAFFILYIFYLQENG